MLEMKKEEENTKNKKDGWEVSASMRRMLMVTRLMCIIFPMKNSKKISKNLNSFKKSEYPVKK